MKQFWLQNLYEKVSQSEHYIEESEQLLQAVVDNIKEDTLADLVMLYPYEAKLQKFVLPPLFAGEPFSNQSLRNDLSRSDNIARLMLLQKEPIFARTSTTLYAEYLQEDPATRQGSFEEREQIKSTAAVTLRSGQDVVGVLFLNFRKAQRFDAAQKLFIAALTNYTTIAIRSAQFIGTFMKRHVHEHEILKQIDYEANQTLELDRVLKIILKQANKLLQADEASIFLYDKETKVLENKVALFSEIKQGRFIPLEDTKGITRLAFSKKEAILVPNVYDPDWRDLYLPATNRLKCIAELAVPLIDGDNEVVGVLNFESTHENAFSIDDKKFVEVLAGHSVLAVKHAQDYDVLKHLARKEAALHQISKDIIGQFDSGVSLRVILQYALDLTNATNGSLHLYNPQTHKLVMQVEEGADADKRFTHRSLDHGIVGHVARIRKPVNIDITSTTWQRYIPFADGIRAELAVPMIAGEKLRGVLNVESRNHRFTKNDEKLLIGLTNLALVALEHAERHQNALREKKRFELLYKVAQALGSLAEMEHIATAYSITEDYAEEYAQQHVSILRKDESPPDTLPEAAILPIRFEEEEHEHHYGYLLLPSHSATQDDQVDGPFFSGLTQQLASTIYRIETTYSKRENEAKARLSSLTLEVVHHSGNRLGLVRSYVNDIRKELKRLRIPNNPLIEKKLGAITQAVHEILGMNKEAMESIQPIKPETLSPHDLFQDLEQRIYSILTSAPNTIAMLKEVRDEGIHIHAMRKAAVNILYNLVTNAIHAMPEGGTIILRIYKKDGFIVLEVQDTGIGIPPDLHEAIFQFGYTTRDSTGFGLWNARWEARINHGDLQIVASTPGDGATFRLLLPNAEKKTGRTSHA